MSVVATTAKLVGGVAAAGAGAAVATVAPPEPSLWAIVVLGIPLSVLAAAQFASAIRHLREPAAPDKRLAWHVVGSVTDGFIGGWLAMLLIGVPLTRGYLGDVVRPEVIGAICALLVQFLRDHAKGYFDRIFDTILGWLARKPAGGKP